MPRLFRPYESPLPTATSEISGPGDDLSHQAANPKMFMDRLASLRKQIGLENTTLSLSEGLSDDPMNSGEGRVSGGAVVNNAVLEATLRVSLAYLLSHFYRVYKTAFSLSVNTGQLL
ncbi:unnamed protein product [Dibothriocephalus latus]|uniref:Uncharacterized protein n=1 Tax=Dibothriocephalus latus TaxID=60516 RepID=A0A3P7M8X6_DIBLA|nr:unnamed protein product [Dibothriocephalus latus]